MIENIANAEIAILPAYQLLLEPQCQGLLGLSLRIKYVTQFW